MVAHDILPGQALASFNGYTVGVSRFSTDPLWERHPAGDEFLQVFEGELDITVLTPEGPVESTLRPGAVLRRSKVALALVAATWDGNVALRRQGEGYRSLERDGSPIGTKWRSLRR